jgi:hypothetical protein
MSETVRQTRRLAVTEKTTFAYIRCGLPPDWEAWYLEDNYRILSRASKNRWAYEQWNRVRQYARQHGLDLRRRFFDAEGTPTNPISPLPLPRRRQLAELFIRATRLGGRTVLVDDRRRLDEDDIVRAVLCGIFREAGVKVIEATTGRDLTATDDDATPPGDDQGRLRQARRVVGLWKGLVSRLRSGSELGRKPFGSSSGEQGAVDRIRELYRVLPRHCWRRRGAILIKRRSFQEIAATLNREGIPTRTGRPWSGPVVFGILKRLKLWKPPVHTDRIA